MLRFPCNSADLFPDCKAPHHQTAETRYPRCFLARIHVIIVGARHIHALLTVLQWFRSIHCTNGHLHPGRDRYAKLRHSHIPPPPLTLSIPAGPAALIEYDEERKPSLRLSAAPHYPRTDSQGPSYRDQRPLLLHARGRHVPGGREPALALVPFQPARARLPAAQHPQRPLPALLRLLEALRPRVALRHAPRHQGQLLRFLELAPHARRGWRRARKLYHAGSGCLRRGEAGDDKGAGGRAAAPSGGTLPALNEARARWGGRRGYGSREEWRERSRAEQSPFRDLHGYQTAT